MKRILIVLALVLASCATKSPQQPTEPVKEPVQTSPVNEGPQQLSSETREKIKQIVDQSPGCTNYFWKNRGKAFKSYMYGMATMYAKQVCGQGSNFIKPNKITGTYQLWNGPQPYKDGLAYYGIEGNELNTYTFLIGLGMRESNGSYCKGRDYSQNFVESQNAEAGIFQTAYIARVFNKELNPLYKEFKEGKRQCELDLFKSQQVTNFCKPRDSKTYGSGEGARWQELMKRCPAASTQWAAILMRSQYRHFGPIIRKEVEFRSQCKEMLMKVEDLVKDKC